MNVFRIAVVRFATVVAIFLTLSILCFYKMYKGNSGTSTMVATQRLNTRFFPPTFEDRNAAVLLPSCGSFTAKDPVYAVWKLHPTETLTSDPLEAIFKHDIYIERASSQALVPHARVQEPARYIVPNVQHYTWFYKYKANLRFHHYLSMLSAQKFNKPECVFFWYDNEPTGPLWDLLKTKVPNLILVYRKAPTSIYGRPVDVPEHKSSVGRLDALIKYGGLYTDFDVLVLKPFADLRVHDVTMGYESQKGASREKLCNGIILSKPNATFLRIWYQEYKSFDDKHWNTHSVYLPAIVAQVFPELIHREIDTFHRPNPREREWLYKEGKIWDWSRNYAVHLWYRYHKTEHSFEDIKTIDTTMGQLFRFVVYGRKDIIQAAENVTVFTL